MDLSKYRQLYVSETQENLEKISQLLVELETRPDDRRAIDTVFRLVHSIKGMSGTMGYTPVFELAHHLEDLMDRFRRLQVPMNTAAIDVILAGADRIGQWLVDVEAEQLPLRTDPAATTLHRRIEELLEGRLETVSTPTPRPAARPLSAPLPRTAPSAASVSPPAGPLPGTPGPGDVVITVEMDMSCPDPGLRGFLLYKKLVDLGRVRSTVPDPQVLRQGILDGPIRFVMQSGLDVSQIEGYLSLVPDLAQVHVRREDLPRTDRTHPTDGPAATPAPALPDAAPAGGEVQAADPALDAALDEAELVFSDDFDAVPAGLADTHPSGEHAVAALDEPDPVTGSGFSTPSTTPAPHGFSEFDFEDVLGDTVREPAPLHDTGPPRPQPAPTLTRPALRDTGAAEFDALRSVREPPGRSPDEPPNEPPNEPDDAGAIAEAAIVRAPRTARSVRVRTDWLDGVLNRTGDLLIIAQRLWNRNQDDPDPVMTDALSELSRLLSALHQDALSVRMTPLSVLTGRLPRAVRDMARRTGKRAQLVTRGDDQHLDRAIIEGLDAPLTHLLSNALEHGIEAPEVREQRGKRPVGTITLTCTRVRDEIVVEVADDGGGVDRAKLADRAVEMGLLARARAEALAARDLGRLLCLPGLTSRDEPGEHSGRGVGLDAVREMVNTLGGLLEVQSEAGSGTTVRLRLPRTPGISKLLLVEADAQVFGLPLARVINTEMFEPAAGTPPTVEHASGRMRVHELRALLGRGVEAGREDATPEAPFPGVICHGDEGSFVLRVDRVVGQQDAVMKPLGPLLERIDGLLGVTIDPVGKPVFIVDVTRFLMRQG
jgi:chemotaxis protein histidine kinase CheA